MDLNKTTKRLCTAVAVTAFLAFWAWASTEDYKETVLYNMPQEVYQKIYSELGHGCTDRQIIDKYMSNQKYYDSLSWHETGKQEK